MYLHPLINNCFLLYLTMIFVNTKKSNIHQRLYIDWNTNVIKTYIYNLCELLLQAFPLVAQTLGECISNRTEVRMEILSALRKLCAHCVTGDCC